MNWRRAVIIGLAVLHVPLSIAAPWLWLWQNNSSVDWLLAMLAWGQACLLALWVVFAGRGVAWRILLVAIAVAAYSWMLLLYFEGTEPFPGGYRLLGSQYALAGLVLHFLVLLPPMLLLRACGLCIVRRDHVGDDCPANPGQFTISQLMICMTALAIFVGGNASFVWEAAVDPAYVGSFPDQLIEAGVSLTLIWLMLGIQSLVVRVPVSVALLAALACLSFSLIRFLPYQAVWIVGSLLVVRLAGYHLHWRPAIGATRPPGSWER